MTRAKTLTPEQRMKALQLAKQISKVIGKCEPIIAANACLLVIQGTAMMFSNPAKDKP